MERLLPLGGIVCMLGLGYAFSTDRKAVNLRTVAWGLGLQFALAVFVLKTGWGQRLFGFVGDQVTALLAFSFEGSAMVFGGLGAKGGGSFGVIVAFQVLPTIIFIAALFAILYHLGVMQVVVKLFARVMTSLMGTSGAESLNAAAGTFMGQTEAPLTVRPFLDKMTRSELMCVMTSGMAHIAAGVMAAYVIFGIEAKHLLAAVIMAGPASILFAKLLVPETGRPETDGTLKLAVPRADVNIVGAAARGTGEGLQLALNVAAMLISFLALVALANGLLGVLGGWVGLNLSLEQILGYVFQPLAIIMGVPMQDSQVVGSLLGTRMVLNEFIAFSQLGPLKSSLDPRSFTIATYALCGFANLGSIGVQLGGIGALVPGRKDDLARLAWRALLAGSLANFVSACIAGMLL